MTDYNIEDEEKEKLKRKGYPIPDLDIYKSRRVDIVRFTEGGRPYYEPTDHYFDASGRVVMKRVDDWGNKY